MEELIFGILRYLVVICRVTLAMFLGSSPIGYFFLAKRVKSFTIFSSSTNAAERTQPSPLGLVGSNLG